MKRTIFVLLAVFMILTMAACGNKAVDEIPSNTDTVQDTPNENTTDYDENKEGETLKQGTAEAKVLVAYFSCTGTTKTLAEYVAEGLEADIYEITPTAPYTDADLDYRDDSSRSTKEMNDPSNRPAISGSVENMQQYDTVFIGYPIWWGEAPRIVSTFMESYDFSGKTIIPFCTSASSGMGSSASNLEKLTSGATWLSGQRFGGGNTRDDMVSWVNGLGLDVTAK